MDKKIPVKNDSYVENINSDEMFTNESNFGIGVWYAVK